MTLWRAARYDCRYINHSNAQQWNSSHKGPCSTTAFVPTGGGQGPGYAYFPDICMDGVARHKRQ